MHSDSTPISRRLFLLPLVFFSLLTILGLVLLDFYLAHLSQERYQRDLVQLAKSGAQLLGVTGPGKEVTDIDYFADRFSANNPFRTTIISQTGTVLGDSQLSLAEVRTIENHFDRPEIVQARQTGLGTSLRYSATLKISLLYVAVRFNTDGQEGYFRVALPLVDLEREIFSQRLLLASFGCIAILLAAILSLFAANHLMALIRRSQEQLQQRLNKRSRELEMLQNLGTQLTACNSQQEALEVLRLVSGLLLPDVSGALALLRSSRNTLEIVTSWNGQWQGDSSYSPKQCWAMRTGKPHLGNPGKGSVTCDHSLDLREQQTLCIPLVAQGETHGVLHLISAQRKVWSSEEKQLAAAIAEHASLTVASLQLRESLRQQAIRDALTGLYNRRYMLESCEHELNRAMRRKYSLAILMIDIDFFKKFNDEHGHEVGDFILAEFGRLLRMLLREEDIACRYGGEEFMVVLPQTELEAALVVAEKIARNVRDHAFLTQNRVYGPITVSIGVAVYPQHGATIDQLFKKADDALYDAKHRGRNQVATAPPPTTQAPL